MIDLPVIVPVSGIPDENLRQLPVGLEQWHNLGHLISFSIGEVTFKQFEGSDSAALHVIRNDHTVRRFMPTPEPLPLEQHLEWVNSKLLKKNSDTPLIVIGQFKGQPIGFGVVKSTADSGTLEVGVIVTGDWQRSALPTRLGAALFAIAAQLFGAHTLTSYVHRKHSQALRLNKGAGLIIETASDKPGEDFFRTPVNVALSTRIYRRCIRGLTIHITMVTAPPV